VPALHELLDQLDHLRHVPRGPRFIGRRLATERRIGAVEFALETVRPRVPLLTVLRRLGQDLVVDVGDVGDDLDLEPLMGQPPPQDVENDLLADMAHMRGGLDCEPAVIDRHLARNDRIERGRDASGGVIELERHPPTLAACATSLRAVISLSTSPSSE
jgi:hypothetical protein